MKKIPTKLKTPARDRILLTAHDLFYAKGIRATGVDLLIKESGVTKVTFYRQFPSKNKLIIEFLEYRHAKWMTWFTESMIKHGDNKEALINTLQEWFQSTGFRGCAFINTVGELGGTLPEVIDISKRHKHALNVLIEKMLPPSEHRMQDALAISLAIDGAIIRVQLDQSPDAALKGLKHLLELLIPSIAKD